MTIASSLSSSVKLIIDGTATITYLDDQRIERVVAQKFEPAAEAVFVSFTLALQRAVETDLPVIYIRIDDDVR